MSAGSGADGGAVPDRAARARASRALEALGRRPPDHPLKERFLRWQCRARQIACREDGGRPNAAMVPSVTRAGESEPMGHVITLVSRWGAYSRTAELRHLVKRENDPAVRRERALALFSESWYQRPREFSDVLTATFRPGSEGAGALLAAGRCTLRFDAFAERYALECAVRALGRSHPLYQATWWHNLVFNPTLHPDTVMLAFEPDWERSRAGDAPAERDPEEGPERADTETRTTPASRA